MPEPVEDLWPPTFELREEDPAPISILKQQADRLSDKTGGLVEGVVKESTIGGTVFWSLYLRAPALGDYMFKVLYIAIPLGNLLTTPCRLEAEDSFGDEKVSIEGVDQFKDWLKSVLNSEAVAGVVSNMIRRSRQHASA